MPWLNKEEQPLFFQKIQSLLSLNKRPTLNGIEQISIQIFQKFVSVDTIKNYIIDSEKFKIVDSEPQDEDRVNVNMTDIDNYYTNLGMCVNGAPASLVFIKIPVRRSAKRSALAHCICCDGTYSKLLVIIPGKTVDVILLNGHP